MNKTRAQQEDRAGREVPPPCLFPPGGSRAGGLMGMERRRWCRAFCFNISEGGAAGEIFLSAFCRIRGGFSRLRGSPAKLDAPRTGRVVL